LSLANVLHVAAQSPGVEWLNWDAVITTQANSTQLTIAETQTVQVTNGALQTGQRNYSQPVNIQSVYIAINNEQQQQLSQGNGVGNYQVSNSNGDMILEYQLPHSVSAGEQFAIQINYTTDSPTAGLIDWFIVPGGHAAPVDSSTVTINFPAGQAPDSSLVRIPQGLGTITTSGDSIIIQSQGAIPANQSFEIQLPYSASVSNAGNSNDSNPNNPVAAQPAPTGTTNSTSGGLSTLLVVVCIVGALVVFGAFTLARGLFSGLGGLLGGNRSAGSGSSNNPSSPMGGGSSFGNPPAQGRGFRESPNQDREMPRVSRDKKSGGGAKPLAESV
jgi:hypothetical protein